MRSFYSRFLLPLLECADVSLTKWAWSILRRSGATSGWNGMVLVTDSLSLRNFYPVVKTIGPSHPGLLGSKASLGP